MPAHRRMRANDRALIRGGHYGQRPCVPHLKAEHMAAPTNAANVKKVLANSEPSTHGRKATFWWRDDDAPKPTDKLDKLLLHPGSVPIALSVIPARVTTDLALMLQGRLSVTVLQHGCVHENRSHSKSASEYPGDRMECDVATNCPKAAAACRMFSDHERFRYLSLRLLDLAQSGADRSHQPQFHLIFRLRRTGIFCEFGRRKLLHAQIHYPIRAPKAHAEITRSIKTPRQSISYSRSITGGRQ